MQKKIRRALLTLTNFIFALALPLTSFAQPYSNDATNSAKVFFNTNIKGFVNQQEIKSTLLGTVFGTIVHVGIIIVIIILSAYIIRHFVFAFNRLFGYQKHTYAEILDARWPSVTILVPAHNEANVVGDLLEALTEVDYPPELVQIIGISDRSTDATTEIIQDFATRYPGRVQLFDRTSGAPGKSAALKDVLPMVKNDIILVFDADNLPGPYIIKQIVSPFFDPEIGAVMARVVPGNVNENLLTRLLELERSGGYQVNQQARENLKAVPQYGGTTGGLRTRALLEVGGWNEKSLAEDTEITFRLLMKSWQTIYQNNAECLEQVPETWSIRIGQIKRWAKGHNQVLFKYLWTLLFARDINFAARLDGMLLLGVFIISPILLIGWILFIIAYFMGLSPYLNGVYGFLLMIFFGGAGNFTVFYEIAIALHLDNLRNVRGDRIRLLPLTYFSFFVSMFILSQALLEQLTIDRFKSNVHWERTLHPKRRKF